MKLILAIVNRDDAHTVSRELSRAGFRSTQLASTGGFLRAGNTTILAGVEEADVQKAIDVIKEHSSSRPAIVPACGEFAFGGDITAITSAVPTEVVVGGATIFVMDVDRFERA